MALWVCKAAGCETVYAVGLPACPRCGGTEYRPDWEEPEPAAADAVAPAAASAAGDSTPKAPGKATRKGGGGGLQAEADAVQA